MEAMEAMALPGVTRGEALRSLGFWSLTAAFFLITLSAAALAVHLVPLLQERGYSQTWATTAAGAVALMSLPGRLLFTPLSERLRGGWGIALIFANHALGLLSLLVVPGLAGVIGFVALFGLGFGAVTPARAGLVAARYGRAHYGQINSIVAFAMTLARALGPLAMSLIYDHAGGYTPALAALLVAALLALAALPLSEQRRAV